MPILGFTGRSDPVPAAQRESLRWLLKFMCDEEDAAELHHGDCVGADAVAHAIGLDLDLEIVIHPPTDLKKRAFCQGALIVWPPRPYLDRNREIVHRSFVLVVAPRLAVEELRSGTWSTVRYARRLGRPVVLVLPDGSRRLERGNSPWTPSACCATV